MKTYSIRQYPIILLTVFLSTITSTAGADNTAVFNYTGGQQNWVVPAGVTSVTIEATGARGGGGSGAGLGARAAGTYNVTPGETLYIRVGGQGGNNGGYNGGGGRGQGYDHNGYGGGGASDVRQGGTALGNRIIVGAGGGGRGASTSGPYQGGNGGAPNGGAGGNGAGGATTSSNGSGGSGDYCMGGNGTLGSGGSGCGDSSAQYGGSGGGGGYRGGGGSGDIDYVASYGAGGGSSYVGSGTSTSYVAGVGNGNGQVSITYNLASNTVPVANDGTLSTVEDIAANGTLTATDADEDPLTYSIVSNGSLGTAVIDDVNTGDYTYTPLPGLFGTDTFTFKANDGEFDSNVATITVTIDEANVAPVADDDVLNTTEDIAANDTLSASDANSGDTLTYSIVTNGSLGTAVITDASTGAYTYTPNPDANGGDSFTFKANDGTVDSNTGTITVSITAVNDPPVASNGTLTVSPETVTTGTLMATDADDNSLTYSIVTNGSSGTAVITDATTGAYMYTPDSGIVQGNDTFTFLVNDGTENSNTASISVNIGNWLEGYAYRRAITIHSDQVEGTTDLVDFPVLIDVVNPDLAATIAGGTVRHTEVNPYEPFDVVFTAADGSTILDMEQERGEGQIVPLIGGRVLTWVKVPQLSATTDTVIYLYYSNPDITTSQENPVGVWSADYEAVWHLDPNVAEWKCPSHVDCPLYVPGYGFVGDGSYFLHNFTALPDSTGHQHHADHLAVFPYVGAFINGPIGAGLGFYPTGQYFRAPTFTPPTGANERTIELWLNPHENDRDRKFMGYGEPYNGGAFDFTVENIGGTDYVLFRHFGGNIRFPGVNLNQWNHISAVVPSGATTTDDVKVYINGIERVGVRNEGTNQPLNTGVSDFGIGTTFTYGDFRSFYDDTADVDADEGRVSTIARSAEWIKTGYNNQEDPTAFITVAPRETVLPISDLTATMDFDTTDITLTWSAPEVPPSVTITDYEIHYTTNSSIWIEGHLFDTKDFIYPDGVSTNTSAVLTNMRAVPAVSFLVYAIDDTGERYESNITTLGQVMMFNDHDGPTIYTWDVDVYGTPTGGFLIGQDEAHIYWSTPEESDTELAYGTSPGNLTTVVPGTEEYDPNLLKPGGGIPTIGGYRHYVALTGLTADTTYYYQLRSRDTNGNFTARGYFTFSTASPTQADFTLLDLEPRDSSTAIVPGGDLAVDYTVANLGLDSPPTGGIDNYLHLSTNPFYGDGDDVPVDYNVISLVSGGQTESVSISFPIDPSTPTGTYFLCVRLDVQDFIIETDESNNDYCSTQTIVVAKPDLAPSAITADTTIATAGDLVQITDSVINASPAFLPDTGTNIKIGVYLSTDNVITTSDVFIANRNITSADLSSQNIQNGVTQYTIPATLTPGVYHLGAIVDTLDTIDESDESNNALAGATLTIEAGQPDLIISALSGPSTASAGDDVSISYTVDNIGTAGVGRDFYIHLYLSADTVITTADTLIGTDAISGLGGGLNTSTGGIFTIPTTLAPGTYYLGAVVDSADEIRESNESNNSFVTTVTITVNTGATPVFPHTIEWTAQHSDVSPQLNHLHKMTTDAAGNVYVAAHACDLLPSNPTLCDSDSGDILTIKYDPDGNELWTVVYDGGFKDRPVDITTDTSGNVYVSGAREDSFRSDEYEAVTIKYDANGNELWASLFHSMYPAHSYTLVPHTVTVDNAGHVFTLIHIDKFYVVEYDDADGSQIAFSSSTLNNAYEKVTDPAGNLYQTYQDYNGTDLDFVTEKYDASGRLLWTVRYDSGDLDKPGAINVDTNDNVYVSGVSYGTLPGDLDGETFNHSTIVKYGPDGTQLWVRQDARVDAALLSFDSDNNIYLAGATVVSYDPQGHPRWYSPEGYAYAGTYGVLTDATADDSSALYMTGRQDATLLTMKFVPGTSVPPRADLVVSDVSIPVDSASIGDTLTIPYSILNQGDTASNSSRTGFHLSPDAIYGGGSDKTLQFSITGQFPTEAAINDGASVNNTVSATVPSGVSGYYHICARADVYDDTFESDESNNTACSDLMIGIGVAPLDTDGDGLSDFSELNQYGTDPNDADTDGDGLMDGWEVQNGTDPLVDDSSLDSDGDGLTNGDEVTAGTDPDNPDTDGDGLPDGWEVANSLDPLDATGINGGSGDADGDGISNLVELEAGSDPQDILSVPPDLAVSDVSGPSTASPGDTISISTTVDNILAQDITTPFKVGIYLSDDGTITSTDTLLGDYTIPSLLGNGTDLSTTDVVIPNSFVAQDIIWTDLAGVSISGGNSLTDTAATGWGNSGAASVQSITGDGGVAFTVTETNTARMLGLSATNADAHYNTIDYAIYARHDGNIYVLESGTNLGIIGTYQSGDILGVERSGTTVTYVQNNTVLYTSTVPSSGALIADAALYHNGATITDAVIEVPAVATGTYFLGAIADYEHVVAEADETNNTAASSATMEIIESGPATIDLVITDVTGPTSATRGDTIAVSTTVANNESDAAGAFKVGIYLSMDATITTADTFLGERLLAGGLAGLSSDGPVNTNVTIPLAGGSGTAVFNYTGSQQSWVVPAGVTSVTIEATGAKGGGSNSGKGARATGTYSVTPGETLYIRVGGQGVNNGGYNGGGARGEGYENHGYGGGGASDVRQGGTAPANRIIVGAGGGGQGGGTTSAFGGNGGAPNGANGGGSSAKSGKGATITTNGAGGDGDWGSGADGQSGNANGVGGKGGGIQNAERGAGGGGGGYRGGGGGGDSDGGIPGGGGGGSSYVGSGTSTSYAAGVGTGHGQVTITYDAGPQTYYLGAIADNENVVTETDESNNAAVQEDGLGDPQGIVISP